MSEPPWLTNQVIDLDRDIVADTKIWIALIEIARLLDPQDWVLVGG